MTTLDEGKTDVGDVVQLDDHRQGNWFDKLCPPPKPPPKLTVRYADGLDGPATLYVDGQLTAAGTGAELAAIMIREYGLAPGVVWELEFVRLGRACTVRSRTHAERDAGASVVINSWPLEENRA